MGALSMALSEAISPLLDYAVATRAMGGAEESGDLFAVRPYRNGLLVAVTDGLGHGPAAATAARIAVNAVAEAQEESLTHILDNCHLALKGTRGAVMSLATLDAALASLTWAGIGNVDAMLIRMGADGVLGREAILTYGGILGHRYPGVREATLPIHRGDMLAFATDGILPGFDREILPGKSPQQIAERILARYGTPQDDALVLIGRWNGAEPGP